VTYPPSGQPYYPEQNQPQYGGSPYGGGSSYPPPSEVSGEQSYTTEPPYSGQPYPYSAQPYGGQPQSGAPYPGHQYPAQPYSAAPYDQGYAPAPQQPAYGQQPAAYQAGYNQAPSFVAPPAQRRGSGGMVALVAGSAVLLLILLVGGAVVLLRSGDDGPDAPTNNAQASAAPETPAPATPTPSVAADYPARIDLPDTVAGLTKVVGNATLDKTANDTALQIKSATNADSAVAAYYAPGSDLTRTVGLFGATGRIANPKGELDEAFSGDDLVVTGVQTVDAGPLGGEMKCGNTASNGQALTVCGWADGGSLMMGIFLNRSLTDSATLFRQIRGEILKRG
jgi:hypothetical protein